MIGYENFKNLIDNLNIKQNKLFKLSFDLFATKGTARKTKNGRDSGPKHYGLKKSDGQIVRRGNIIAKTCNKFLAGKGVSRGKDYTIFCTEDYGVVKFTTKRKLNSSEIFKKKSKKQYNKIINVEKITLDEYLSKLK